MKRHFVVVTLLLSLLSATAPLNAQGLVQIPITGTSPTGGSFQGTFDLARFAVQNGVLVAVGTLTGVIKDAAGNVVGSITKNLALPVTTRQSSCEILFLELGPLSLNLLGLQIDLSKITLEITAVPGAGNLLGNLLCAVANLLNSGGPISQLVELLNQILRAL